MPKKIRNERYDVAVAGGGMAGCAAAVAAARHGVRVVLLQNRPVLGGNMSSEARLHALGADCHTRKRDAREGGFIEEVLLENRARNPEHSFAIADMILWEKLRFQENLTLYLNTHVIDCEAENGRILSLSAENMLTETRLIIEAQVYIDCTGDGTLAALAGAAWMHGKEAQSDFNEPDAPDRANAETMGNTLELTASDRGHVVPFYRPDWARDMNGEALCNRAHGVKPGQDINGWWWNELGGGRYDTIDDADEIRDELLSTIIGVWDHLKNSGEHPEAENYELDWLQFYPSKRESRRIVGDYVLTQNDCLDNRIFPDAIAYGGWHFDLHSPDSVHNSTSHLSVSKHFEGLYTIPYRCLYSQNVENLMMAGRLISATSLAHSSARVIATAAVTGQAAGTAAQMAVSLGVMPREIGAQIVQLQQRLLRDGCFIPGFVNVDNADFARAAQATASSAEPEFGPELALSGYARNYMGPGGWVSAPSGQTEWLRADFDEEREITSVELSFDSDYNREIHTTHNRRTIEANRTPPPTLVRDFRVERLCGETVVDSVKVSGNYQAKRRIVFAAPRRCSAIRVCIDATHGDRSARIFELRAY